MKINPELRVDQFDYDLQESLIAQEPAENREMSRLFVLDRRSGAVAHYVFHDIDQFLIAGDVLVLNDVKVIPARLYARRSTGAHIQITILNGRSEGRLRRVLLKPARRITEGENLVLEGDSSLNILERQGKEFLVRIDGSMEWSDYLARYGLMPLPPYIKRGRNHDSRITQDHERYQTVFAVHPGAVAAPTAGLHFTTDLLHRLKRKGVICVSITLWVGWGTFKPIECQRVADHIMDEETYMIPEETAQEIRLAKKQNRRVIAVGTTTTRALESWVRINPDLSSVAPTQTGLFITPGFEFGVVDGLITNFHLPGSSLIMLVSAFGGMQNVMYAYHIAVSNGYRFYSYGDTMLII